MYDSNEISKCPLVVARFEKIREELYKNLVKENGWDVIKYEDIKSPCRATHYSAGYDFCSPMDIHLEPNESVLVPTFIRCKMNEDVVLILAPRSSLGVKYHMILSNTVGVIDADYYDNSTTEGHIYVSITNLGNKTIDISAGDRFCQGILMPYYRAVNDDLNSMNTREGGFGSTNK